MFVMFAAIRISLPPTPAHGLDEALAAFDIELLAQDLHIGIDVVRADVGFEAPDAVKDDVARHDDAGVLREQVKELELARRELDDLVAALEDFRRAVQREAADFDNLLLDFLRAAAAESAQARKELGEFERLDEVVVGAGVEPRHAVFDGVARRQHEDGALVAFFAQAAAGIDAALPRHHPVEDEDVVVRIRRVVVDFAAVLHPFHLDVVLFEHVFDEFAEALVILGEQDAHDDSS